jgi:RHS repeat-associated protein
MAFEQEQTGTTITNRHYVSAMGQAFLMLTSAGTHTAVAAKTITDRQWWHRDHLGSIASITNASYVVTQRFSYDPFGKRRDITGSYDANGVLVYDHPTATDRGFTGHEHLDDVGIIHMNGRLYDPRIGRFLQADPYIQRHDNTQSYNRYSYVLNNPLNATDPSGQIAIEVFYWAAAAIFSARAVGIIDTRTARQLLGLLVTAYIAGMDPSMLGVNSCSAAVDTTFIQAVAGGIAGGAVSCGADCAGMAGASAITFFAIGQWANGVYGSDAAGQQATGRAIAHGVGGCVISTFEGGKCGQGAATAFLGKAITSRLDTTGYLELDIARAGVIGGTLSSIGGGKFANGAMMGAFQYLFNALSDKLRGGARMVAKGAQGTAMMVADFVTAGWVEVGSEVGVRTKSGLEGRIDAVLLYKGTGNPVFILGEAKNGPYAEMSKNQNLYLREVSNGDFEFKGPKGEALKMQLFNSGATQLGVVVRSFNGSPAENRPTGRLVNEAVRDAAARGGIRGGWLSE